jgi:5-(carboxyamino)imidazole ribonucleotide synthase
MTTIGVIGAGQLARMLALAGLPLGLRFVFLDPATDACAAPLGEHLHGEFNDHEQLTRLAQRADVVTFEFENVPQESIEFLAQRVAVRPGIPALISARDRLLEKNLFRELGIPTASFMAVDSREALESATVEVGLPAILKTRTLGYDGKGQALLRRSADLDAAWSRLGGAPLILEGFVNFTREVSVIGARGYDGDTVFYPLSENIHRESILRVARSRPRDQFETQAHSYAERLLNHLDYVGVLALELFQVDGTLIANEMAPRVHNSGHWTIEGAETSQFENHLRAILSLPLGSTAARGYAAMVNFIGKLPDTSQLLAVPSVHLHRYEKAPRSGRKLGHATVLANSARNLEVRVQKLLHLSERR